MLLSRSLLRFATLASLALAAPALAQTWRQATPATSPPARAAHALASDVGAGRVVLFGGYTGASYLGDTWSFDGVVWSPIGGTGPSARARHAMAYDARRGVTVLFGGINGIAVGNWLGDTWEFQSGVWQQRPSTSHPLVRMGHAMAYDAARGRVVMFGGRTRSGTVFLNDTWEWDGANWLPLTPAHAPTARMGHAMAYDPVSRRVLLFGGLPLGGPVVADTWAWNGVDWLLLAPSHAPAPRMQAAMATDLLGARIVLYGGSGGTLLTDTAEWDGHTWRSLASSPSPAVPVLPAMATGPSGWHVVLFGGEDAASSAHAETWWNGSFAALRSFGAGCGTPPLTLAAPSGSLPALGANFVCEMGSVPTGGAAFVWLGISSARWLGVPLPFDLTPFGLSSCALYQDAVLSFAATTTGSTARLALSIPNLPDLVGYELYEQGWVLAPGSNPAGALTSNALGLLFGAR